MCGVTNVTATSVARASKRATHIHIATHGFSSAEPSTAAALSGRSPSSIRSLTPLSASGLALSNADQYGEAAIVKGAILSGDQLAHLDLTSCALAVLSACDTGIGDAPPGIAAYSLRRALHEAGAERTITSLWPIPDHETQELMVEFYRLHLAEGLSISDALWKARMNRRNAGATPRTWAAWALGSTP